MLDFEVLLQQYLIEAFTRAIFELSFILVFKDLGKVKEKSICNQILNEWIRKKLVEVQKVSTCKLHTSQHFSAGICCLNERGLHLIHLWHEDFKKCDEMCRIKEPQLDARMASNQLEVCVSR